MYNKDSIYKYRRSKKGLTATMYSGQRSSARKLPFKSLDYKLKDFREWCMNQGSFHSLYELWVQSDYDTELIPSADRINSNKSYRLDNLEVVTFAENKKRSYEGRIDGSIHYNQIPVLKLSADGEVLDSYVSMSSAGKSCNLPASSISSVCSGKTKTAGGFRWEIMKNQI